MSKSTYGVIAFRLPFPEGTPDQEILDKSHALQDEMKEVLRKHGAVQSSIREVAEKAVLNDAPHLGRENFQWEDRP